MSTLTLAALLLAPSADPKTVGYAALFPTLGGMYQTTIHNPEIGKGEVYKQMATFEWTGGRAERLNVTFARDPAFKEAYSAAALKKSPAKEVEVGKKKGYLMAMPADKGKESPGPRLVVVLSADKVVIIDQYGFGADVEKLAATIDLEKVEKALDTPPGK
jgi:hypothetical protein